MQITVTSATVTSKGFQVGDKILSAPALGLLMGLQWRQPDANPLGKNAVIPCNQNCLEYIQQQCVHITHDRIARHLPLNEPMGGDGWAPLSYFTEFRELGMITKLLEAGANPNEPRLHGKTPLQQAVKDVAIVTELLKYKADPNAYTHDSDNQQTSLHMICDPKEEIYEEGNRRNEKLLAITQLLLQNNANPNLCNTNDGRTPLFNLISKSYFNAYNPFDLSETPTLCEQFIQFRKTRIALLIQAQGNIHHTDRTGKTALQVARESKDPYRIQLAEYAELVHSNTLDAK